MSLGSSAIYRECASRKLCKVGSFINDSCVAELESSAFMPGGIGSWEVVLPKSNLDAYLRSWYKIRQL